MDPLTCWLPGGYVDRDGTVHRDAELLPLSGREEEFLAERQRLPSAALVTAVLERCVRRIGGFGPPLSEELVRNLLVADRQYLLLKLREATFGDQVQGTLPCAWPDCGNKVDIDFSIRAIPIKESEDKGPVYRVELSPEAVSGDEQGPNNRWVSFRLPNGADQEAVAPLLAANEARALSALLARCVLAIGEQPEPDEELIARLSPRARWEIEARMDTVAPKVELNMEIHCPVCGREFTAPFDLQDFFFGELRISRDLLYREVHYLAYHYHWSEREIMDMPRDKRRHYIAVLADEIERLNNAL